MTVDITTTRPSRAVSWLVSGTLVLLWLYVRLVYFHDSHAPIAYILPLLVTLWTRDRYALWVMAVIFVIAHTAKVFWILPPEAVSNEWTIYSTTIVNILVGAGVMHVAIGLRERLEESLHCVRAQADELQAQGEELAQQNEELAQQNEEMAEQAEELSQQGEELATQNEELASRADEVRGLNDALARRERLLQTLLDTARRSGTEQAALQHIAAAALDLFGDTTGAAMVFEAGLEGTRVVACATADGCGDLPPEPVDDAFAAIVIDQGRTASLTDTALRPDLALAPAPVGPPFRAVLCTPIRVGDEVFGALAVYATEPRLWSDEDFPLAEWLCDQCGRTLQTLRVQSMLRDSDRRKAEFLATLSHELRNPLTPIAFGLSLIEQHQGHDADAVRIMKRQLNQLVRLVDDLLEATRLSRNTLQLRRARTDVVPVIRHAVEALYPEIDAADHQLEVDLPSEPVWVNADVDRLAQVVTNLLNNAIRYTPRGGRLTVALSTGPDAMALAVRDTGVGLDRQDLDRVFDMFMQVGGPGSGGLGIGLALVRQIAELHGGRVEARSAGRGRGSEFEVTLPLAASAEPPPDRIHPSPAGPATRYRVLVVDDNVDSASMIAALLRLNGHDVRVAHDAPAALAAALEFSPQTAVLDIGLPEIDGYELARRLRQDARTREMRLVALTGWGQEGDRAQAREAGFDAHLTKPVEPDVILAMIATADRA